MSSNKGHLKQLDIKQYRNIENLKFEGLSKVNIIIGENNVGKTSILETIRIVSDSDIENPLLLICSFSIIPCGYMTEAYNAGIELRRSYTGKITNIELIHSVF